MLRICFNLTFDNVTEQAIRTIWHRLAALGLVVGGLTGYRPHITLAVYEDSDSSGYETPLVSLAATTPVFPVRLDSLGIFPEAGALFLAPRMSQTLFNLHRHVLRAFEALDRPSVVSDLLLPDRWMPHCTLVGRLTPVQLLAAIEAYQRNWTPIQGDAVGIAMRLWPAAEACRFYRFGTHEGAA